MSRSHVPRSHVGAPARPRQLAATAESALRRCRHELRSAFLPDDRRDRPHRDWPICDPSQSRRVRSRHHQSFGRAAKPKLPHACNMASQILNGAVQRIALGRSPPLQLRGCCMSPEKLAVLRTLAIRPSSSLAESLVPTVVSLEQGGLVTNTPTGWIATAKGCEVLEGQRPTSIRRGN
jgi:hypothetical protein